MSLENSLSVTQTVTTTKVTRVSISDTDLERSIIAQVCTSLGISESSAKVELEWDVRQGGLFGCDVVITSSTTEDC